jgi:Fe-S cluster biogenesis protein NfuA
MNLNPNQSTTPSLKEVELILSFLRPAMQADGGDVELASIEGTCVFVRLKGSCMSCPSSSLTLKFGIERALREKFPSITKVIRLM